MLPISLWVATVLCTENCSFSKALILLRFSAWVILYYCRFHLVLRTIQQQLITTLRRPNPIECPWTTLTPLSAGVLAVKDGTWSNNDVGVFFLYKENRAVKWSTQECPQKNATTVTQRHEDSCYLRHWLPMGATLATPTVATFIKRHWLPKKKGQWLPTLATFLNWF